MIKIPTEEFRTKIKNKWPNIDDPRIWPRGKFFKPYDNLEHLKEVVRVCSIKGKYRYVKGAFECEFFATQLMAAVWAHHYETEIRPLKELPEEAVPYFYGLCIGMRFKVYRGNHNVNIAFIGKDLDIALIDASSDEIWLAEDDRDDPYFILR